MCGSSASLKRPKSASKAATASLQLQHIPAVPQLGFAAAMPVYMNVAQAKGPHCAQIALAHCAIAAQPRLSCVAATAPGQFMTSLAAAKAQLYAATECMWSLNVPSAVQRPPCRCVQAEAGTAARLRQRSDVVLSLHRCCGGSAAEALRLSCVATTAPGHFQHGSLNIATALLCGTKASP